MQTAISSHLYFNFFIYEKTPEQVLEMMLQEAKTVCEEAEIYLQKQFEEYIEFTNLPKRKLSWDIEVTSYEDYILYLNKHGVHVESIIQKTLAEKGSGDLREVCFSIVNALQEADPEKKARVILFFAPPFLPHNYLKADDARDVKIQSALAKVLKKMGEATGEQFEIKKFFPYLADGSFLSIHETDEQLAPLLNNLPEWDNIYTIPFNTIKNLNIPSINMGVYGKDGHKWTERVYKPYSFGILPELIRETTIDLLEQESEKQMLEMA